MTRFSVALLFCLLAAGPVFSQNFAGESVEFDPVGHRFLTSDDGTSIVQRAADGTISHFGSGLKASYGMEVMNGLLFALEGSKLMVYDLATATEKAAITIPGSTFLNGLASDGIHLLWATDFTAKKIFQIDVADLAAPVVSTLVSSFGGQPNGVVFDAKNSRLVVVSWGSNASIKAVSLPDGGLSTLTTTTLGNIDGIDMDTSGNFFTASWSPSRISKWPPDFSSAQTITVPGLNKPADICYASEIDTLAIPNTGGTNTLFVDFGSSSPIFEPENGVFNLKISPNPVNRPAFIEFHLQEKAAVRCELFDLEGRHITSLAEGNYPSGEHRVLIDLLRLEWGVYVCRLTAGGHTEAIKLVVE